MRRFLIGALFLFGIPVSCLANVQENLGPFTTSVGADLQTRQMTFKKDRSPGTVAKPRAMQGGGYFAFTFPWFGLELGYERSQQDAAGLLLPTDTYFSDLLGGGSSLGLCTKTSIRGPYANLAVFLPISDEYRLKLLGFVGMGRLHAEVISTLPQAGLIHVFSERKWIPRAGIGVQHTLNKDDSFGIRAMMIWEKTSKFEDMRPRYRDGVTPLLASFKNSIIPTLGVFYNF